MANILVFDIGTSSMRGILYNHHGKILFKKQIKYAQSYLKNRMVEQSPADWENGLLEITRVMTSSSQTKNSPIDAISLTSQRSSLIPLDSNGTPLHNAIMWQDKRTNSICDKLKDVETEVYKLTGLTINPIYTAPKISWLKQQKPQIYKKTFKFSTIHDYILHLITGKFVTDHSIASRTLLFNINTLQWDKTLLSYFDIDGNKLNDSVEPGSICGSVSKTFANISGLKEGIPVVSAGGDQQCAVLGMNILTKDKLQVNTGTGSFIVTCTDRPVFDKKMRVSCNVSAIPGKYTIEAGIPTTGTIYRWFNENFYQCTDNIDCAFDRINIDASASPVGANELIVLPHFEGRGAPYFNALGKGIFFNVTLSTEKCDFVRAILEGVCAEIQENVQVIQELVGSIPQVLVSGGLSAFDLFNQIQADMYRKNVSCYQNKEATALGAWISCAKTLGLYESYQSAFKSATQNLFQKTFSPIEENALIYDTLKTRRKKLYDSLVSVDIYSIFQ